MSKPFFPKPGQVDFRRIRWAPVVNCVVRYQRRILIVRRSRKLRYYPGYWNGISGFLDDQRNLETKVRQELREELGMSAARIKRIDLVGIFNQEAPKYKKTWIVHAILVTVRSDHVHTDWEADDWRWVSLAEAKRQKLLPGFDRVLALVQARLR